jgi:hypothetical protein
MHQIYNELFSYTTNILIMVSKLNFEPLVSPSFFIPWRGGFFILKPPSPSCSRFGLRSPKAAEQCPGDLGSISPWGRCRTCNAEGGYSYLRASTGFSDAALQLCKLTVTNAIMSAIIPAIAKIHQLSTVLYAND